MLTAGVLAQYVRQTVATGGVPDYTLEVDQPLTAEEFERVSNRHQPHWRSGRQYCTRDWDEFWPCDAARLLATVGDAFAAGALIEYREAHRRKPVTA